MLQGTCGWQRQQHLGAPGTGDKLLQRGPGSLKEKSRRSSGAAWLQGKRLSCTAAACWAPCTGSHLPPSALHPIRGISPGHVTYWLTKAQTPPTATGIHPHPLTQALSSRLFPERPQMTVQPPAARLQASSPPHYHRPNPHELSCLPDFAQCGCSVCTASLPLLCQVICLMAQLKCTLLWEALPDLSRQN